jgi:CBS domain-containing protein
MRAGNAVKYFPLPWINPRPVLPADAVSPKLNVGSVATRTIATCEPEDDLHVALTTMKEARVRRLPVVGFGGVVLGVLSMNDIVLAAGARRQITGEEVLNTLQAICGHHHPVPHIVAA